MNFYGFCMNNYEISNYAILKKKMRKLRFIPANCEKTITSAINFPKNS